MSVCRYCWVDNTTGVYHTRTGRWIDIPLDSLRFKSLDTLGTCCPEIYGVKRATDVFPQMVRYRDWKSIATYR